MLYCSICSWDNGSPMIPPTWTEWQWATLCEDGSASGREGRPTSAPRSCWWGAVASKHPGEWMQHGCQLPPAQILMCQRFLYKKKSRTDGTIKTHYMCAVCASSHVHITVCAQHSWHFLGIISSFCQDPFMANNNQQLLMLSSLLPSTSWIFIVKSTQKTAADRCLIRLQDRNSPLFTQGLFI